MYRGCLRRGGGLYAAVYKSVAKSGRGGCPDGPRPGPRRHYSSGIGNRRGGKYPRAGWPSRMPVRRRLCLDFSRTGSSGSHQECYESLAHVSATRVALPFCHVSLRVGKTKSCDPRTLGDHIRLETPESSEGWGRATLGVRCSALTTSGHLLEKGQQLVKSGRGGVVPPPRPAFGTGPGRVLLRGPGHRGGARLRAGGAFVVRVGRTGEARGWVRRDPHYNDMKTDGESHA